jgi:methionyl-tRNA formyltransferase
MEKRKNSERIVFVGEGVFAEKIFTDLLTNISLILITKKAKPSGRNREVIVPAIERMRRRIIFRPLRLKVRMISLELSRVWSPIL